MKKIFVPYISQWDENASFSKNDCIPVCASMLLAFYGRNITPDEISKRIGTQGLVNFQQLQSALTSLGIEIHSRVNRGIKDLEDSINENTPFISILHYGDLPGRQDTYSGGHAVLVVGYDDKNVFVNDPDFWGERRGEGAGKAYPKDAFLRAWQSTLDGNLPGNFWFLSIPKTFSLNEDIPTEVESEYKLKEETRYDKHWTFGELLADWRKLAEELRACLEEGSEKIAILTKKLENSEKKVTELGGIASAQLAKIAELGKYEEDFKALSKKYEVLSRDHEALIRNYDNLGEGLSEVYEKKIWELEKQILELKKPDISVFDAIKQVFSTLWRRLTE